MSCEDDLAYARQVLEQVQAGLAYQQASYNRWMAEVLSLRTQAMFAGLRQSTEAIMAGQAATAATQAAQRSVQSQSQRGEEQRASSGDLDQLAGLHRTVTDMEARLDKLETK